MEGGENAVGGGGTPTPVGKRRVRPKTKNEEVEERVVKILGEPRRKVAGFAFRPK